jgi:hypothetical protein
MRRPRRLFKKLLLDNAFSRFATAGCSVDRWLRDRRRRFAGIDA